MCYGEKEAFRDKVEAVIRCPTSTLGLSNAKNGQILYHLFPGSRDATSFLRSASLLKSTSLLLRYD